MLPEGENEACYKAFYCAIRSDDIQFIETLISDWCDVGPLQLDETLSKAYEELKLKNVPLSHEMQIFVEKKILDFRFFSISLDQDQDIKTDLDKIKERIKLTVDKISLLASDYSNLEKVDEKFLFIAKFIAQNLHTLKRQLRSTYNILPWEEIEFCLVIFVSSHEKLQEMNLFYRATWNKRKILKYLILFAEKLERVIIQGNKLHCLPRFKRDQVILDIIGSNPEFEELYEDYQKIRDVYSLQKISDYINRALSADPHEKEGQLIITRALQVIGEHLKNTLESPKLSHTTSQLLIQSLRTNARDIIVALRDSISHADSLAKRIEIEEKANMDFSNIQNDLRKVGEAIIVIFYNHKIKKIRKLLEIIVNSEDLNEVSEVLEELSAFKFNEMEITENFKILEHEKLESLLKKFYDEIKDMTNHEEMLFSEINEIMIFAETRAKNKRFDYVTGSENLQSLSTLLTDNKINQNLLRVIRINAITALQNITLKMEPPGFQRILKLIFDIVDSVIPRKEYKAFDEFYSLFWEIHYMLTFVTVRVKWMEQLRERLQKKVTFVSKAVRNGKRDNLTEDDCNRQLQLKLLDLNSILNKNSLIIQKILHCKTEKKLEAALEMLLLDIMSILGISKYYLRNNALFIDDYTPLLHGTCLRNHLAHDNVVVDILSAPVIAVILNAKIISTQENVIIERQKTIGKLTDDNPQKLRKKFDQGLLIIINQNKMFDALKEGNLESLEGCIEKGADIKARSMNLWTTLHFAAVGCSLEVIKFILDHNISVDVKDKDGETPLHVAAANGRQNIVDFFIREKGVNVDEANNRGKTPLHVASQNGHKDTVELLIKHKANAVAQDTSGFPPLYYAIRKNHTDIAKILLEKYDKEDINKIMGGCAPLHEAAESGNLQLVNLLLEFDADVNVIGIRKNDVIPSPLHPAASNDHLDEVSITKIYGHTSVSNERVIYGFTPLHVAAENGHDEIVARLLKNGACVQAIDAYHATPLHYAAIYGHEKVVNLLLKSNANVNAAAGKDRTPLHIAVWSGHLKTVAALIKHGVDIHAVDDVHNITPLRVDIDELLIINGSDINAKSNKNLTALHGAISKNNIDVADHLIAKNADVNAQDDRGVTPLLTAALSGNTYIINLLIKKTADVNIKAVSSGTSLQGSTSCGHIEAVDLLIRNNPAVNATDNIGRTPLHFAVHKCHADIVNLLIDSGAKVNAADNFGFTPLHIAAIAGKTNIIDVLLKNNADVNTTDLKGKTPLHKATIHSHIEAIDFLIKNNAEINAKDSNELTPLHHAVEKGNENIVKLLIDSEAEVDAAENTGCRPLHLAATKGRVSIIDLLIRGNAEVNIRDFDGRTPLHAAVVGYHNIQAVNVLIKNNAEINAADDIGSTALHLATLERNEDIINFLIDSGAAVDAVSNTGCSSLYVAAMTGNTHIADILIKNNADVNIRNVHGMTPLHSGSKTRKSGQKSDFDFNDLKLA